MTRKQRVKERREWLEQQELIKDLLDNLEKVAGTTGECNFRTEKFGLKEAIAWSRKKWDIALKLLQMELSNTQLSELKHHFSYTCGLCHHFGSYSCDGCPLMIPYPVKYSRLACTKGGNSVSDTQDYCHETREEVQKAVLYWVLRMEAQLNLAGHGKSGFVSFHEPKEHKAKSTLASVVSC